MTESHHAKASHQPGNDKSGAMFAEFINPNSMITPGAAGAFTMVITNTLCQQFAQLPLNFTGLAVSFMFGAMVFGYGASLLARIVYFVINSLIIFVVAVGSSAVGTHIDESSGMKTASIKISQPLAGDSGFNLAGDDKDKADDTKKPPEKPKFFRKWL